MPLSLPPSLDAASSALPDVLAGAALGGSLIVAIGAQNLFVLRQGARREHTALVVALCIASDAALILAGAAGVGWVLARVEGLETLVRYAAAAYLVGFAALSAVRAARPGAPAGDGAGATSRRAVVLTTLALTWLNPHVYLDTVLLLGSVAGTRPSGPWPFAVGAVTASVVWFCALGAAARSLGPLLRTERARRVLDAAVAVVLLGIAAWVVLGA